MHCDPHDCLVTRLPHASPRSDSHSKLTSRNFDWPRPWHQSQWKCILKKKDGATFLYKKKVPIHHKLISTGKKKSSTSSPNIPFSRYTHSQQVHLLTRPGYSCLSLANPSRWIGYVTEKSRSPEDIAPRTTLQTLVVAGRTNPDRHRLC